jgi:hypothetical protein
VGIFYRGERDTPDDPTASWFRERMRDAERTGDGIALAEACAALAGHDAMAFNLVVNPALAARADLREEALAALRRLVPTLGDDQYNAVVSTIEAAGLDVDTERAPDDPTTSWFREGVREAERRVDAIALAEACATLKGRGSLAFGTVVTPELAARTDVCEEALAALRRLIPEVRDDQCDAVFRTIEAAGLDVDIGPPRAAFLARTVTWLREQIAVHQYGNVVGLAAACATMTRGSWSQPPDQRVFGRVIPSRLYMEPVREQALAAIRARIPTMTNLEVEAVAQIARNHGLPLDFWPGLAEREARKLKRYAARLAECAHAAASEPRNPDLERDIEASLERNEPNDAAFAVLGDWLQMQAHPRGELIALQLRGADAADYLSLHDDVLLGPLRPDRLIHDGMYQQAFTWQRGFIHRAHLSNVEHEVQSELALAELLELVFCHPSARYLHELVIGIDGDPSDGLRDAPIAMIAAMAPMTLRSLVLGEFDYPTETAISWYRYGDLALLWPSLARLCRLVVQGAGMQLGEIMLPDLEHAEFRTGGLPWAAARAIAEAHWPKIRSLDVWFGDHDYGGDATIDDVQPLLARTDLVHLTRLGLMNAAFTDEICAALVDAPIINHLAELDLAMGTMTDEGAGHLVNAAARWPSLPKLVVSDNCLTPDAIVALRRVFPSVITDDQKGPHERRPSVGE